MVRILVVGIIIGILACVKTSGPDSNDLLRVDQKFSRYSETHGMRAAFLEYMHPECILLRDNANPVVGSEEMKKLFAGGEEPQFVLTWEPFDARIAESNDLGFTYGKWTRKHADTTHYGTYTTFWKKSSNGDWKWILDTGNDGLGN